MNEQNKIALVTGGGSGLGLAIARKFTSQNIFTIIVGRNKEKLDAVARELGTLCAGVVCDVTHLESLPALVNGIVHDYGKIDILVNNAGIHLKKPLTEVTDAEFQQVVLTNLTAVFALSRTVAKQMLVQKNGYIVNISSMASQYGIPYVIAYTAAKAGVEGMTRAMAVELSPFGIRINCIAPGFIQTDMSASALDKDPERKKKVLSRTPMGKLGKPEDVANMAYYLVSGAADYMTGTVLPVDGGNCIGF